MEAAKPVGHQSQARRKRGLARLTRLQIFAPLYLIIKPKAFREQEISMNCGLLSVLVRAAYNHSTEEVQMAEKLAAGGSILRTIDWVRWADSDFLSVRQLLTERMLLQGCVLANKAVEKYLKGVCASHEWEDNPGPLAALNGGAIRQLTYSGGIDADIASCEDRSSGADEALGMIRHSVVRIT
jgi:hypothetical protein